MIRVSAFCCLPIDIAVRLIGTISLLTHAFVFIALVSYSDVVLTDDKSRIIFGFDSQFFDHDNLLEENIGFQVFPQYFNCTLRTFDINVEPYSREVPTILQTHIYILLREFSILFAEWYPTFCLIFTLTAAVSSALLIWASIISQRWLTVPWLICSLFNVICHFASLVMLSFYNFPSTNEWVTAFSVLYSVATLYFMMVVTAAHFLWWIQSKESCTSSTDQEVWENIFKSPPLFESPYKNQV